MARKTIKAARPTFERFKSFKREGENQNDALARLLDTAGVPEHLECAVCAQPVQAHARDDDGRILCFECAGVPADVLSDD